jgi:predicted nucleic acid-binding protein
VIPSGLLLVDTSAIARVASTEVRNELSRLGQLGLLATCVTIDLEVLYSARSPEEYRDIAARRLGAFTDLPITPEICQRARAVQSELARTSQHRAAGVVDLLTAAAAEHYGSTILHYDRDFDHIAAVSKQPSRWIAPPGSLN